MKSVYDSKPSILEAVGNGSYLYRWNIQEEQVEQVNNTSEEGVQESVTRTQWTCEETTVWMPLSANKVLSAVISEKWDGNYEQKLINEFNAANLGVYSEDEAVAKIETYKSFLNERALIKAQVDEDCATFNIQ